MSLRCPPDRLRVASASSSGESPSSSRAARARPGPPGPPAASKRWSVVLLAGEHPRHPVQIGDHLGAAELRRRARSAHDRARPGRGGRRAPSPAPCGRRRPDADRGRRRAAPAARDLAAVGSLESRQDLQQRRLAAAVRADDADPRLRLDRQVRAVEDETRAERLRDRAAGEQRHAGGCALSSVPAGNAARGLIGQRPRHAGNVPLAQGRRSGPIDTR